jgi:hypothetical protein
MLRWCAPGRGFDSGTCLGLVWDLSGTSLGLVWSVSVNSYLSGFIGIAQIPSIV